MSSFDYTESIITVRRKGDSSDPYIPISINKTIKNGLVQLPEIPDIFQCVAIAGNGETWFEIQNGTPVSTQYKVSYLHGYVEFDPANEGKTLNFSFLGTGNVFISSERVWVESDGNNVTKTLADVIAASATAIEILEPALEVIDDAKNATSAANTSAVSANTAANTANAAATNADQKAMLANAAADNANSKADLADQKANLAAEKAALANTAADLATSKATLADQSAINANIAAAAAVTAKENTDVATQSAIDATNSANNTNDDIQAAEVVRVSQENTRQSNESARTVEESARQLAETSRANAEVARTTEESNRVSAEIVRQNHESDRQSAEIARADAESIRVANENSHISEETARTNAESSRATAENERVDNETARQSGETNRETAESNRAIAETNRVDAESSRLLSESDRVSVENQRVIAENTRISAETDRETAEADRANAENTRVSNETSRQQNETTRQNGYVAFSLIEPYNSEHPYVPLNKVIFNGSTYQCIASSLGNAPTDTNYWILIAQKGVDGTGSGTVTSVSSANGDIIVSNPTDTPTLTVNSGTGANQLLKIGSDGKVSADLLKDGSINIAVKASDKSNWDAKQDILGFTPENPANKAQPGGYASLDVDGKIPMEQIPDDVITNLDWDNITNKPTSTVGEIDVAVSKTVDIGDLQNLYTSSKSNLVAAINEAYMSSGSKLVMLRNTVDVSASSSSASIGISDFNKDNDTLMVYVNSVYIEQNVDYTVSNDSLQIFKVTGNWDVGTHINFVVLKNVATTVTMIDPSQIQDGSIQDSKLHANNKIGQLSNLTTTAKSNVVSAINELRSDLNAKQDDLGFIPEDAANKAQPGGYASLGVDGKIPMRQIPDEIATNITPESIGAETPNGAQAKATQAKDDAFAYANQFDERGTGTNSHAEGDGTIASGESSHSEGINTIASGKATHAEGWSSNASGNYSHAEGRATKSIGLYSHAEGSFAQSIGTNSHAEGEGTKAVSRNSHAEGYSTKAAYGALPISINGFNVTFPSNHQFQVGDKVGYNDTVSHIIFDTVNVTAVSGAVVTLDMVDSLTTNIPVYIFSRDVGNFGANAHAEGSNTISGGNSSHAEGINTIALGDYSHAEGLGTTSSGTKSHAEGDSTSASGESSHAEGSNTIASGKYSHSEGYYTKATNESAHAEGNSVEASGKHSHAEGGNTRAFSDYSHVEGNASITHFATLATKCTALGGTYDGGMNSIQVESTGGFAANSPITLIAPDNTAIYNRAVYLVNSSTELVLMMSDGTIPVSGIFPVSFVGYTVLKATGTASGSHAEGNATLSSGDGTHSEGVSTKAIGIAAHAEGYGSQASGNYSHAEGYQTYAGQVAAHAEGYNTVARSAYSHAEGYNTVATSPASHAEGYNTLVSGYYAHAKGYFTNANVFASHVMGQYNKQLSGNPVAYSSSGDAFVIGCGTSDTNVGNAFRVTYTGKVYGSGTFGTSGADYAEYFEWSDGNENAEDRVGTFVTLDEDKIRIANSNDSYILGVVSVNPSVAGDTYEDDWCGKYLTDEWGRFQYQEVEMPAEYNLFKHNAFLDEEGNILREAYEEQIEIRPERTEIHQVLNPEWDGSKPYIPRSERKEWSVVGMMGKLLVRDDGTCVVNGYCKSNDEGIATNSENGHRVMKRITDNIVQILVK
ncbi:peptidase G2 autoproteolytic cleavage domain-containing protein [Paenibacillus thalictri]|uniref:Peptidase G2 IMC autoproteolytic cleavage domain-containing protein n=1 Tax=Paenibacillus thalictri TaxID=2527873 RepID=A0A4V2J3X8_9BACL|nr:peptidase G2 autoproteolytic cleavage domain-containing protein [Paenibacillus thalictri]TBL76250.1 hypothetical protein EYB31_19800 [Paenibacillus thalictri]